MTKFQFDSIPDALNDLKSGRLIVVVDDENRENEGDLIGAAQFATPEMVNFMAVKARGLICLAMTGDRLDRLDLPLMVDRNTDSQQTAFTVSIDAVEGTSTGISAEDRSRTIQAAINPNTRPNDLRRPGHVFPLRAKDGGVLKRAGHTEAAVDLAQMSGLYPAGVICEIQNDDGSMARLPELIEYAKLHNLKLISIADLISYRLAHDRFVQREAIAKLPSLFGNFRVYAYRNTIDNTEHLAIVKGDLREFPDNEVLVRVHSECLTGDALGSLRCDCRGQLQSALKMIEFANWGVVVYLRQEGRGIGLINKIKAYCLQDGGLDTVEANEKLGFGADLRTYGVGAQILHDLGIKKMRLITNNPRKLAGLKGFDIEVVGRLPLLIETNEHNWRYLETKAEKLGHLLLQTKLITLGIRWTEHKSPEWLAQLREVAATNDLLMQEETSTEFASLFANADTQDPVLLAKDISSKLSIVHLGFDRSNEISDDWYEQPNHPYRQAIVRVFKHLKQWEQITTFKFCVVLNDAELPESFVETINLGLAWNTPWKGDRMYEWFNFFLRDGDDLAILDK
ncbi:MULTISPECIES: bifunctional 3,4-dihydroxy-2-butanone-4-phosphate synthase/GTP cyclohydrolase II [Pseudanabaena]|uniref:bifunctional 3,4-dihydroxy-2-butanone-4-phosphate synthase/GTP cyclohydrolase II n=1 Tax=Pseudanabaena TaxID=1152 RepID=UPI00247983E0|nr:MULTISPECIES: bifunctional 3,4-dihydroxy-2-butanone-4-phosphate synthase/GTP cyclohydrolase II [Pseudanabaena]MEA5486186.1 bifunctional 3,4-dihydroxy-2-butanone-4-phosphate synthase/GTP cyclohydrolase II [Pseudanabaena sp. CCNP1317]WGS70562.1 bifunctional 3,4-dihydroxy-2-butanone-4-phosphate synthase/GTP cyclohydrolase II [Pseudanabaena galeata CCNP1313]